MPPRVCQLCSCLVAMLQLRSLFAALPPLTVMTPSTWSSPQPRCCASFRHSLAAVDLRTRTSPARLQHVYGGRALWTVVNDKGRHPPRHGAYERHLRREQAGVYRSDLARWPATLVRLVHERRRTAATMPAGACCAPATCRAGCWTASAAPSRLDCSRPCGGGRAASTSLPLARALRAARAAQRDAAPGFSSGYAHTFISALSFPFCSALCKLPPTP